MKKLAVLFALVMACGVGCGGLEEDYIDGDESQEIVETEDALAIGGGGLGGGNGVKWCAARKDCYDKCDRDYGTGGGPRTTCGQLCDIEVKDKCRAGVFGGGGGVFIP